MEQFNKVGWSKYSHWNILKALDSFLLHFLASKVHLYCRSSSLLMVNYWHNLQLVWKPSSALSNNLKNLDSLLLQFASLKRKPALESSSLTMVNIFYTIFNSPGKTLISTVNTVTLGELLVPRVLPRGQPLLSKGLGHEWILPPANCEFKWLETI